MSRLTVGDRVIKNPRTWVPNPFDEWGRGLGVGAILEPPIKLKEDVVDVRWPCGRCLEPVAGLLPVPTGFQLEVLGWLLDDYESVESIRGDIARELARSVSPEELIEALSFLVEAGLAQAFNYDDEVRLWRPVGVD